MKTVNVLGFDIFNDDFKVIEKLNSKILINTMSPNSFSIAKKNIIFMTALKSSEIITLDGLYFGLASKLLNGITIPKKSGTDWFYYLMKYFNNRNGKVMFIGSTKDTLLKIKNKACIKYPKLRVRTFSPPYKSIFDTHDIATMVDIINEFNPDVVFLGLTAPKQEILSYQLKEKVNARIICSIGNVFDWYSGNQKQPEKVWVILGLEWLIRTIRRPEIFKRYPNIFYFFWILFLNVIKVRKD